MKEKYTKRQKLQAGLCEVHIYHHNKGRKYKELRIRELIKDINRLVNKKMKTKEDYWSLKALKVMLSDEKHELYEYIDHHNRFIKELLSHDYK